MRAVIKIGGSLASSPEELRTLMQRIEDLSSHHSLVIVPGGGPFADNVRELQGALNASDSSAHWMAILGMEQFGELLAQYAPKLEKFSGEEIAEIMSKRKSFILQPYRLIRTKDELPHTWNVTSDSIAIWIAILIDADIVVLAKSTDNVHDSHGRPGDSGQRPVGTEELKSLAKNGIVDAHLPLIHPNYKGALHVIDGRKQGVLDQILRKEDGVQ
jgi:aspartokinase-like uncharacterized kinase